LTEKYTNDLRLGFSTLPGIHVARGIRGGGEGGGRGGGGGLRMVSQHAALSRNIKLARGDPQTLPEPMRSEPRVKACEPT
jgi:hypothetical protein